MGHVTCLLFSVLLLFLSRACVYVCVVCVYLESNTIRRDTSVIINNFLLHLNEKRVGVLSDALKRLGDDAFSFDSRMGNREKKQNERDTIFHICDAKNPDSILFI